MLHLVKLIESIYYLHQLQKDLSKGISDGWSILSATNGLSETSLQGLTTPVLDALKAAARIDGTERAKSVFRNYKHRRNNTDSSSACKSSREKVQIITKTQS